MKFSLPLFFDVSDAFVKSILSLKLHEDHSLFSTKLNLPLFFGVSDAFVKLIPSLKLHEDQFQALEDMQNSESTYQKQQKSPL